MAQTKTVRVIDVLALMKDDAKVVVAFSAFGIPSSATWADGLETVGECKQQLNEDKLHAKVLSIEKWFNKILVKAELGN